MPRRRGGDGQRWIEVAAIGRAIRFIVEGGHEDVRRWGERRDKVLITFFLFVLHVSEVGGSKLGDPTEWEGTFNQLESDDMGMEWADATSITPARQRA